MGQKINKEAPTELNNVILFFFILKFYSFFIFINQNINHKGKNRVTCQTHPIYTRGNTKSTSKVFGIKINTIIFTFFTFPIYFFGQQKKYYSNHSPSGKNFWSKIFF
jgi:hypothetical protein